MHAPLPTPPRAPSHSTAPNQGRAEMRKKRVMPRSGGGGGTGTVCVPGRKENLARNRAWPKTVPGQNLIESSLTASSVSLTV
eukprot:354973-Chlamydomonas_euryale.AAC.9